MGSTLLLKDYPDGYPNEAVELLKDMSFTDGKNVVVVGSMSLRSQVYAGDYDANEMVIVGGTKEHALKELARKYKNIIRRIQKRPLTYIGDIKCGSVEEWKIMTTPYNPTRSLDKLEELYKIKIISKSEYLDGKKRFKPHPSYLELLLLEQDFRPNIIRWTANEILKGYKILQDGRKFTIEQAIDSPAIAKLDVISWVQNNRFTDFSMIHTFKNNGKVLNPSLRDFEESIKDNIYVLHHEKKFYKMSKRIFSLAKFKDNQEILEMLSPLFNGDLGRLYIVYGDIGTIEDLFSRESNIPFSKLELEFDQFKGRLSNITLPDYIKQEHMLFNIVDKLIDIKKVSSNKDTILHLLKTLKNHLLELLSKYSKEYLIKHRIFPSY